MSTKTESTTTRPALTTLIKNKIAKLNRRVAPRSKSSPALMVIDSNIQSPVEAVIHNKPISLRHTKEPIPDCQHVIDLS